mgnify:FL=1|tara:strand:- start:277 stop:1413 length:1137 start_codon:yes stop_codon:yes gene_type:complete
MPIAGTRIPLNSTEGQDRITITEKVTSPYFSDGSTELLGASIISTSLSDTNETYYFGVSNSNTPTVAEFHVAFGSLNGYGGNTIGGTVKSPTEAIYKEWANILLPANEVTGGFFISDQGSSGQLSNTNDDEIFILVAERSLMKDRLNKKNWTIALSGSATLGVGSGADGAPKLELTDDSTNDSPTATPVGDRYNIVSGTNGTVHTEATTRTFGFYYPDMGVMVFSAAELSASIPGSGSAANVAAKATFGPVTDVSANKFRGFAFSTDTNANEHTALRFVNCLKPTGAKLKFRDEEDQVSSQYFCRAKAGEFNFSNNPTFVSGSQNELRQSTMRGNPTTFITSVQLYNGNGDMVAVGNLSTPLKKNFSSEATIKVKLTY